MNQHVDQDGSPHGPDGDRQRSVGRDGLAAVAVILLTLALIVLVVSSLV